MIFHRLNISKEKPLCFNNPFNYEMDEWSREAFRDVVGYIDGADAAFKTEACKGKMFGALVVENEDGETGFLAAYSGQINSTFDTDYFVPAIFDYLDDNGYFKTHEREISDINHEISELEKSQTRKALETELASARNAADKKISDFRNMMAIRKQRRDQLRQSGQLDPETEKSLIAESQHQKAELKRLKQNVSETISGIEARLMLMDSEIEGLKKLRKEKSDALQNWLFSQFEIVNYLGERKKLLDIFRDFNGTIPPSGSGECCAPKLLQYAFLNGYKPIQMVEFWYGESPKQEIRHHLHHYPACNGKCKPILDFMLRGLSYPPNPLDITQKDDLEYIYEDDAIVIVNKPAGMLSVPGKSGLMSAYDIVRERFGEIWICHRLDMATSGILVFARNKEYYENIHSQFEVHSIKKRYTAILDGISSLKKGKIALPLIPDIEDRPRQKVDHENGKFALTEFEVIEYRGNECVVYLYPHTGRTHQLRVHCAHPDGLNIPIKGDELYGRKSDRLYLHAGRIEFIHPKSGKKMRMEVKAEF